MILDSIVLSKADLDNINSWKMYGDDYLKRITLAKKAKIYIAEHLEEVNTTGSMVGRCCSAGTITYRRKDGDAISDEEINVLLLINRGQENRVQTRTEKEVTIYWLCDSSD